jgi:hypothetical protein
MRRISLLVLVSLSLCGCALSRPVFSTTTTVSENADAPEGPLPVTPRVLEQLPTGRYYRVNTFETGVSYVGKIARSDSEGLVLSDVDRERRAERTFLSSVPIPAVSRLFKGTMSIEPVDGDHSLPRSSIKSVELLSDADAQWRETLARHKPPSEPDQIAGPRKEGWRSAG